MQGGIMQTVIEENTFQPVKKRLLMGLFYRIIMGSILIIAITGFYVAKTNNDLKKNSVAATTELKKTEDLVARVSADTAKLEEVKSQVFNDLVVGATIVEQLNIGKETVSND